MFEHAAGAHAGVKKAMKRRRIAFMLSKQETDKTAQFGGEIMYASRQDRMFSSRLLAGV